MSQTSPQATLSGSPTRHFCASRWVPCNTPPRGGPPPRPDVGQSGLYGRALARHGGDSSRRAAALAAQRFSFLSVWVPLPPNLREIAFDLHDPGWDPPAIEQLGDVLCDLPDLFFTSKTDFGSCSLMPFEISVPETSAPATSRPHRINPTLAKEVDATPNQYLAAGLVQHSTSPY